MHGYFASKGRILVTILVFVTALVLQSLLPSTALANHYAQRGRLIEGTNYGSGARIGTTNPPVGSYASFEFIGSSKYVTNGQIMVQTGWTKQAICGTGPFVFWEHVGQNTNGYVNRCTAHVPSGDNDYYNEYDGNNGYWCHGYNGSCLKSVHWSVLDMSAAANVMAYGETNHADPSVQMGGKGSSNAIYISNIKRKLNPTGSFSFITTGGVSYGSCPSTCPYSYNWSYAANVLYTYNWTP